MRKIILSVLGLLLLVGSVFVAKSIIANKKKPKTVTPKIIKSVVLDTVKNGTVQVFVSANGNLRAKRRVELYSEVSGVFKKGSKLFKQGETFKKGQTLINVDASEYYASVQSSKSNLYNSVSAVMPDLQLDYPEVYAKWQKYLKDFDIRKSTPSLPELETDRERYFITGKGILSSYYNVKNLEQRLAKYRITAPFNGILTESLVNEGTLIRSGQKLGEFIDPSVYEVEVAISKSFVHLLKKGKQVELSSLDKKNKFKGIVTRINGSINATTQTVAVFIELSNSVLKEGDYLEANVSAEKIENVIEVDRNLLVDNNQIFAVKDSSLYLVEVIPVYFSDSKVVLKNVPDKTVILKKALNGAYEGMLVKPFNKSEGSTPTKKPRD